MTSKQPTLARQAQITDAALRLIGLRGIADLTMAHLAAEVGVSTGALFRHFPSREAILEAVAIRATELAAAATPPATLPPLERLTGLTEARMALMEQRPEMVAILFSEQLMLALPPAAVDRLQDIVVTTGAFVAQALQEARQAGHVRDDLPLPHLVAITMGTIRHLVFLSGTTLGGKMSRMTSAAEIWQSYLTLIRPGGHHADDH
jgi:AcrR family transcriptional regulator